MKHLLQIVSGFLTVLILFSVTASAHTYSQAGILEGEYIPKYDGYHIGGESIGWSIDETLHIGTTSLQYKFTSEAGYTVAASVKTLVRSAASMWSEVANITESTSAIGTIFQYNNSYDGAAAYTELVASASNGHLTSWSMYINVADTPTTQTAAHEFGHVIGLNDLYANHNGNKLMYHTTASTATSPTSADLWGAKVILGIHTTHSFDEYRYWGKDTNGNHYHVQYCSDCNGNRATRARCFFSTTDPMKRCITCGYSTYLAP